MSVESLTNYTNDPTNTFNSNSTTPSPYVAQQLSAAAAAAGAEAPNASYETATIASNAATAAEGQAWAAFEADIANGASGATLLADGETVLGDALIVLGAAAELSEFDPNNSNQYGVLEGQILLRMGESVTTDGVAPSSDFVSETESEIGQIQSAITTLSNDVAATADALTSAWDAALSAVGTAVNATSDMISDFGDSTLPAAATSAVTDLGATQVPLANLVNDEGVVLPNVTETATNVTPTDTTVTVAANGAPATSIVNFNPTEDGSPIAISIDTEDPTTNTSQITTFASDGSSTTTYYTDPNGTGSITEIDQENSDGTSTITTYNSGGSSTATNYSGPEGTGTVTSVTIQSPTSTITDTVDSGIYEYMYTGPPFSQFTSSSGFTGQSPLEGLSVTASIVVDVTPIPPPNVSTVYEALYFSISDGLTTYAGANNYALGDEGGLTLEPNLAVANYALSASTGNGRDPGSSEVATQGYAVGYPGLPNGGGYDQGGDIDGAGDSFYATTSNIGVWSQPIDTTIVTISPLAGQTQQLSDALASVALSVVGLPYHVTVSGPGTVQAMPEANTPVIKIDILEVSGGGNLLLQGVTVATDPVTVDSEGNISGFGMITGDETVNGTITASGGALDIAGNINGTGVLTFDAGAALAIEGTLAATDGLEFNGPNEILMLGSAADVLAPLSGLVPGDIIGLEGQQATSAVYNSTLEDLVVTGSSGANYTLAIAGSYQQSDFSVVNGEVDVTCFLSGTHISAGRGDVRIESLAVGELVQTNSAGFVSVKWIGRRRIDCLRHPDPRKVWPVRIRSGAFGEGLPRRDLWLSPDHAVYADDVLIPIKHLINGMTIEQIPMDEVTYYHIELDQHDVLFAEGLPAESYLDTGDRSKFTNGSGPITLHPDFSVRMWEAMGCAPLVVTGPVLTSVRTRLLQRAAHLAVEIGRRRSRNRKYRTA
jgi:hypothetical protein